MIVRLLALLLLTLTPTPRTGGVLMTMTPSPAAPAVTQEPTRAPRSGVLMTMTPVPGATPTPTPKPARKPLSIPAWLLVVPVGLLAVGGGALTWRYLPRLLVRRAARQGPWAERQARLIAERDAVVAAAKKREREQRKQIAAIAKETANQIREVMTSIGYRHDYRHPGQRKTSYQRMTFSHALVVGTEMICFRVGMIPWDTTIYTLFEEKAAGEGPWMARELSLRMQREVRIVEIEGAGTFIEVGLKYGIAGIPRFFLWRDPRHLQYSAMDGNPLEDGANAMRPVDNETRLQINLGVASNRRVVRVDLRACPNLVVAGVPGSGKSVFLNQLLCTFIERNDPADLDLRLIDLKGGLEFDWFAPLLKKHVREFVEDEAKVAGMMERLIVEIHNRYSMMRGEEKKIDNWNAKRTRDRLPYIVLVIDELSTIMLNQKLRKSIEALLMQTVALGRATGVHLILCTQVVKVEILPTIILGNIPAKMVFNCANQRTSMMVLGHAGAAGLEPAGRGFWQYGAHEEIVQAPYIMDEQIRQVVAAAAERKLARTRKITIEEIMIRALTDNDGLLPRRDTWTEYRAEISQRRFERMLKDHEFDEFNNGPVFDLSGTGSFYKLAPGNNKVARRVVRFDGVAAACGCANSRNGRATEPEIPKETYIDTGTETESDDAPDDEPFDFEAYKRSIGVTL